MAIATPLYLGAANATVSASSWSTGLITTIPAGARALMWISTNNIATSDGASNTHESVTSGTLTWTKVAETTASSGVAEDGVTISAWLSSVAAADTAPSFTVNFSGALTNRLAQGVAVSGSNLDIDAWSARTNYALMAYGSMTLSALPSKQRLWLRMSGGEYGASTNATPTSGWTINTGTNNGSTTAGLLSRSEYKIATSTEETSAFTQNVALDSASIFVAISEDGGGGTPISFSGSVPNQTGTEGTAFSLNLSTYFSGTETPFSYAVQAGTLPAGLTLNTSTGVISGTPTTTGTSSGIVIRATDATPNTADTNSFSITINAANTSPSFPGPNIADISGTEGTALTPVDVSGSFFDAESSLTFSAVGSWPAGVTVSGAGVISGTPTTAGTYSGLQVRATDAGSLTADSNVFTITVAAPGDTTPPELTGVVAFSSITQTSYTASWPAGSDNVAVTGYEYQIGSTEGAWTDAGDNLSAAITGRTAGMTETVYVRAYDAAGLRSTPAISGEVTLESIPAAGINVTDPLKNNTGTVLASQSGIRAAVLQAADLVSVFETSGLTTNASGILATISDAAIITGQQYHVAIKLADGGVGITGPITAS